jgi:hypothetical protein
MLIDRVEPKFRQRDHEIRGTPRSLPPTRSGSSQIFLQLNDSTCAVIDPLEPLRTVTTLITWVICSRCHAPNDKNKLINIIICNNRVLQRIFNVNIES